MVVNGLEEELAHGGCVDEYLRDQLVVFQALAGWSASVDYGNKNKNGKGKGKEVVNLHTKTVEWVAEEILGAKFSSNSNSKGGGQQQQAARVKRVVDMQSLKTIRRERRILRLLRRSKRRDY